MFKTKDIKIAITKNGIDFSYMIDVISKNTLGNMMYVYK